MAHQQFYAERDGFNINTVENLHVHNGAQENSFEEAADESSSGSAAAAAGGGGFGLVVLLFIGYLIFGGEDMVPFPDKSDPWPEGVSQEKLLSATNDWMQACSRAVVAEPANCPQSVDDDATKDAKVRWTLYGDPIEKAQIAFTASDDRFNVLGSAVMVATYELSGTTSLKVQPLHYWAKVVWKDGQARVEKVHSYRLPLTTPIAKHDPNAPWPTVQTAVSRAFQRCAAATKAPLPAGCPATALSLDKTKVKWTIDGDPALTATPSFDPRFGLIRVKGSYSLTANYRDPWTGNTSKSEVGNYEATVVMTGDTPVVLEIKAEG